MISMKRLLRKNSQAHQNSKVKKRPLTVDLLENRELLAVDITTFPVPVPNAGQVATIQNLSSASDGQIWFVEILYDGNGKQENEICRISSDGKTTVVVPPSELGSINPNQFIIGSDGNEWFVGSKEISPGVNEAIIGRITEEGEITTFDLGSNLDSLYVTPAPDGGFWIAGEVTSVPRSVNQVMLIHVDQSGSKTTTSLIATLDYITMAGVATDRAGNVWVGASLYSNDLNQSASVLFCYAPNGVVSQYSVLPKRVVLNKDHHPIYQKNSVDVNSLTKGPDGNIWIAAGDYSKHVPRSIWKVTPGRHFSRTTAFPIGVNGFPGSIIAGNKHHLFFTVNDTNWDVPYPLFKIGVIDTSGHIRFLKLPHAKDYFDDTNAVDPAELAMGADGNLWFNNWLSSIDSTSPTGMLRVNLPHGLKKS